MKKTNMKKLGLALLFCSCLLGGNAYADETVSSTVNSSETVQSSTMDSAVSSTDDSIESTIESETEEAVEELSIAEELEKDFGGKKLKVTKGESFSYRLAFKISNEKVFKKIVLQDILEPVFTIHSVSVASIDLAGKEVDVTKIGKLSIDQENNAIKWTASKSDQYFGRYLFLDIVASVKDDADLSKYEGSNGQYLIPNVGSLLTDDEKTDTDEVIVTVDPEIPPTEPVEPSSPTPIDPVEPEGKPLPQTGEKKIFSFLNILIGLGVAGIGGVGTYEFVKRKSVKSDD